MMAKPWTNHKVSAFFPAMTEPRLKDVACPDGSGGHRMAYWHWGDPAAGHAVVCLHGLSRQGRDFDTLARALLERSPGPLRVIYPDVVGRGRSEWLREPMGYQVPTYAGDMLVMLAALNEQAPLTTLDCVGTSMGGLIAMALAGTPQLPLPVAFRRLVLNDVGPEIQWSALQRIGTYLGQTGRFASLEEAAAAMWTISSSFGPHTPQQWLALSAPMVRPLAEGGFTLHYDPAIAVPFRTVTEEAAAQGQEALWQLYDNIRADVLITRGASSDLLSHETAIAMTRRGAGARLVEFEGVGHAPTFIADNQIGAVASFLLRPEHEEPDGGAR
jgi:pimeloyl-ACP methyl ester carboxylesterase